MRPAPVPTAWREAAGLNIVNKDASFGGIITA